MGRARNKRSNNSKKKEGKRSSSNSSRAAAAAAAASNRKKQKTTNTSAGSDAKAAAVAVVVSGTTATASNNNDDSFLSELTSDILYHLTTFLDEVQLYCLEEAFPKQIKKSTVSHKRWKEMLKLQNQIYSVDHPRHDLLRMMEQNGGLLTEVVPRWPPQDETSRTTAIARGRYFAQEVLYAMEMLRSKEELSPHQATDCGDSLLDYRLSRQEQGPDIFVTIVTREGHYFATSMPKHCGMEWEAKFSIPYITIYWDYINHNVWWTDLNKRFPVTFGIAADDVMKEVENLERIVDDFKMRGGFDLVTKDTTIHLSFRRKRSIWCRGR